MGLCINWRGNNSSVAQKEGEVILYVGLFEVLQ